MSDKFDVIFHWGELHAWLGKDWRQYFSKDTEEVTMPMGSSMSFNSYKQAINSRYRSGRPIHEAITQRGWSRQGVRIAVMGFSQTCIGAAVLLASPDAGNIDFAYACDGIHGSLDVWTRYANLCAFGAYEESNIPPTERALVITHSQTPGPGNGIPSTQESATKITKDALYSPSPVPLEPVDISEIVDAEHEPVNCRCSYSKEVVTYNKIPGLYATKVGNLWVLGYKNMGKTCTDHIYQSKVIGPRILKHILVPRWNDNDRNSGACVVI